MNRIKFFKTLGAMLVAPFACAFGKPKRETEWTAEFPIGRDGEGSNFESLDGTSMDDAVMHGNRGVAGSMGKSALPRKVVWTIEAEYDGPILPQDISNAIIPPGPWYKPGIPIRYAFEDADGNRAEWSGAVDPEHGFHSTIRTA